MTFRFSRTPLAILTIPFVLWLSACASDNSKNVHAPAHKFDLSHWSITVPTDSDGNGKVDTVKEAQLANYSHSDFFHLDPLGRMVFTTPNQAVTTKNSSNTRSELRYMSRGGKKSIANNAPANNFALKAHSQAQTFASVGSKMEATLHVDAVALNAGHTQKFPAYSAVVGQIHAVKFKGEHVTAGWGNEPLKIFYKKWPGHKTGSIFWTYERNLAKANPERRDIAYPVWGNTWDIATDPGDKGIALGEEFSYTVNVYQNIMTLTFETAAQLTVRHEIDLSNNVDAFGQADLQDNPLGYSGDSLYFKAGIYDQCSTKDTEGFWYAACAGTGDWKTDHANGDFARATFSRLLVSEATPN